MDFYVIAILKVVGWLIGLFLLPILYPFRGWIRKNYKSNKIAHFFAMWFAYGDPYCGPTWFRLTFKWLDPVLKTDKFMNLKEENYDPNNDLSILTTFKLRLQYFIIVYIWCGIRNGFWNFQRWYCERGAMKTVDRFETRGDHWSSKPLYEFDVLTPCIRYWDPFTKTYTSEKGYYLVFLGDLPDKPSWWGTKLGYKKIWWSNDNGKFTYTNYADVFKLPFKIKKKISIEYRSGWNTYDGLWTLQCRIGFCEIYSF